MAIRSNLINSETSIDKEFKNLLNTSIKKAKLLSLGFLINCKELFITSLSGDTRMSKYRPFNHHVFILGNTSRCRIFQFLQFRNSIFN